MKLVIDIPQGLKIDFENENWTALTCAEMKNALMRGTPLPKGHGRLIDADCLGESMYHEAFETDTDLQKWEGGCWIRYKMFENKIDNAPTIIEADKVESEDKEEER